MLSYAEDKGVVHDQALALWLDDIEVVPLGMWSRMACQKVKGRILTRVGKGQSEC